VARSLSMSCAPIPRYAGLSETAPTTLARGVLTCETAAGASRLAAATTVQIPKVVFLNENAVLLKQTPMLMEETPIVDV